MKNKVKVLFIALSLGLISTSCEWKSEEEEVGIIECDTSQVTLSGKVKPILQSNCYACHSSSASSSFGAGIDLENYESLKVRAEGGSLFGVVNHSSGFSPMPKAASKLSDCNISLIKVWVDNGAPND